jgi:hypothetical protein
VPNRSARHQHSALTQWKLARVPHVFSALCRKGVGLDVTGPSRYAVYEDEHQNSTTLFHADFVAALHRFPCRFVVRALNLEMYFVRAGKLIHIAPKHFFFRYRCPPRNKPNDRRQSSVCSTRLERFRPPKAPLFYIPRPRYPFSSPAGIQQETQSSHLASARRQKQSSPRTMILDAYALFFSNRRRRVPLAVVKR